MSVYVCARVCVCECVCVCVRACVSTRMYVYACVCIYICTCRTIHVFINYINVHGRASVRARVRAHDCVNACYMWRL